MAIKAAFFDIDGTLVSFKTHQIPASTIKAIEQAKEQGVPVRTLISGEVEALYCRNA